MRGLARCRNQHGDKSLCRPGVEERLVSRGINAVHSDPAGPLALDPDGGIPGIGGIPVYAERDHPVSLGRQMIEIALMLGTIDAMICFEHATSCALAAKVAADRRSITGHCEARIDAGIFMLFLA